MHIVLDIPQQIDMDWLLKLFQQLNLRVVQKTEPATAVSAAQQEPMPEHRPLADPELWNSIVKPIRQSQSIEDMVVEQNYKGFDRAEFDRLIAELGIQDPDGELLQLLRA